MLYDSEYRTLLSRCFRSTAMGFQPSAFAKDIAKSVPKAEGVTKE